MDAVQLHIRAADLRLGALVAAVRAAVVAEVTEVDRLVGVRVPAAAAVLGVRGVLHLRPGEAVVVDAEVNGFACRAARKLAAFGDVTAPAAQVRDQGIVGMVCGNPVNTSNHSGCCP